jgi:hypothetical protein
MKSFIVVPKRVRQTAVFQTLLLIKKKDVTLVIGVSNSEGHKEAFSYRFTGRRLCGFSVFLSEFRENRSDGFVPRFQFGPDHGKNECRSIAIENERQF